MTVATNAVIIDDEIHAIQQLTIVCQHAGIEVLASETNPLKTIDLIRSEKSDLVFWDLETPQRDGIIINLQYLRKVDRKRKSVTLSSNDLEIDLKYSRLYVKGFTDAIR